MANETNEILIRINVDADNAQAELQKAHGAIGTLEKKFGVSTQKISRSFNRVENAVLPARKATKDYEAALEFLSKELQAGRITQDQFNQGLERANMMFTKASKGGNQFAAMMGTRGLNSSRAMGTAIQQAGYQVGDFAVQVASGQSAMRAFIQQGTQLISMFGPYGAVAGAVLAIGGAIYTAFAAGTDEADKATESAKTYADALKDIAKEARKAELALDNLKVSPIQDTEDAYSEALRKISEAESKIRRARKEQARKSRGGDSDFTTGELQTIIATNRRIIEEQIAVEEELFKIIQDYNRKKDGVDAKNLEATRKKVEEELALRERLAKSYADGEITLDEMNTQLEVYAATKDLNAVADKEAIELIKQRIIRNNELKRSIEGTTQAIKDEESAHEEWLRGEDEAWRDATRQVQEYERERKRIAKVNKRAAEQFRKEEERAAKAASDSWERHFSKMGDALSTFVETGKLDFRSLASSIISDIIRIQAQETITKPLSSAASKALGSFDFGSLFSGGTRGVQVYDSPAGPGYALGGEVRGPGSGTSDSIPAMLSNGEYVVNAKATSRHRELLEALNSGKVMRRFSAGGPVTASVPRVSNQGGGITIGHVDMRGASVEAVQRLETFVNRLNGSIESRSVNAVVSERQRNPALFRS